MRYNRWADERVKQLKDLIELGHTRKEIMALMGITYRSLESKLGNLGLTTDRRQTAWDDVKVDELRRLTDCGWSASKIGKALGVSRNSIIGKWHRLGIQRGPRAALPRQYPKIRAMIPFRKPPDDSHLIPIILKQKVLSVPFMELQVQHCRYILPEKGPDGLATFCGNDKAWGHSWCPSHCQLIYDLEYGR